MSKSAILALCLGLASPAFASGIEGNASDSAGKPRANVRVSVSGYSTSVRTDAYGNYRLELPKSANGKRVNVYVNGKFAVNCLVPPEDDCYSTVNVVYEK